MPRRESFSIRLSPDERANLDRTAERVQLPAGDLVRREIEHVLKPRGLPIFVQMRLFLLEYELKATRERRDDIKRRILQMDRLVEAADGALRRYLEHAARELTDDLVRIDAQAHRLEVDIANFRSPSTPGPRTSSYAIAFAPLFLLQIQEGLANASEGNDTYQFVEREASNGSPWGIATLLLIGLLGVGVYILYRRGALSRLGYKPRHEDEGAPREPPQIQDGWNVSETLHNFWTSPPVLRHRIQYILDQDDGLEHLRVTFEDSEFESIITNDETAAPEADAAKREEEAWGDVRILICTEDQYQALPLEFRVLLSSRRARKHLPTLDAIRERLDARERVVVTKSTNGAATLAPPAPKRPRGRPRKERPTDPTLAPAPRADDTERDAQ